MRKQDLDRLNELRKRFENDNEYKEYEKLLSEAGEEISKAKPERSPIGMVNGDMYVLLLPYDELTLKNNEWTYVHRGFDMEIRRKNGTYTHLCESYCNRDAQYFVDRMLADKEKAERKGKEE